MCIPDCLSCGFKADRDTNATHVMITYALTGIFQSGEKITSQLMALGLEPFWGHLDV